MEYGQEKIMLEGMVTQIVYRNEANGYTVMELMTDDGEELTAVGYSPMLGQGERAANFRRPFAVLCCRKQRKNWSVFWPAG